MRPPSGAMIWWHFKSDPQWHFGYVTYESGGLLRLGRWNGDSTGGSVVSSTSIEWKPYS